jgi:hypothetical protein
VTPLRWLAFGDLDSAAWGLAWAQGDDERGQMVIGTPDDVSVLEAHLEASSPDEWRLHGDAFELTAVPAAGPGLDGAGALLGGLVRVQGTAALEGDQRPVSARGWAGAGDVPSATELDSLRLLAAWFDDGEGLAVLAVRPRRARGQEGDDLTVSLIETGVTREVIDPRLSTTYDGHGAPTRAGMELWVSEPSEDPESVSERPHRLAGEAVERPAVFSDHGLELRAQPFRWHAQGRDGAGVYVLGSPR